MPFYFALPRPATFSGSTQGGTLTKSDYIRTQPSQVLYQLTSGFMYPFKKILYSSLSLVAKAIVASGRSPPEKVDFKTPAFS
jgi:hypothetical protein